jgi:hypothetical protein
MPNHVINEIIFRQVDHDTQTNIVGGACNAGRVDFGILVPSPLNLWMGSVGSEHEKKFKRTSLDWNRENWGTKWNAYGDDPHIERGRDTLTLRFQTAWSPPYPWLAALLNKFGLPFEHNWLDEGCERAVSGQFRPDGRNGGPEWSETRASDEMQRHLHKLLWGVEEFADEA